jgi:hypothetical protein
MSSSLEGDEWSASRPGHLYSRKNKPLDRRLGALSSPPVTFKGRENSEVFYCDSQFTDWSFTVLIAILYEYERNVRLMIMRGPVEGKCNLSTCFSRFKVSVTSLQERPSWNKTNALQHPYRVSGTRTHSFSAYSLPADIVNLSSCQRLMARKYTSPDH